MFPAVPLTISYFLNQQHNHRSAAVRQALLFSAGIVVPFSAIGILVTLLAGPFGVAYFLRVRETVFRRAARGVRAKFQLATIG